MSTKYVVVSGTFFGVIALAQAVRALNQWPAHVASFDVPVWGSWLAAVLTGSMCVWAFQSLRK
jgi:hypothetical protein